ncbi:MAG: hypothetical protein GY953_56250 [bacterium]|nr:hypothetical protein [bacterium]
MPALTIRNIPEETIEDLRRLAKQERRSLNAQALWCLDYATQRSRNQARRAKTVERILRTREVIRREHGVLPDSTPLIRQMRDERSKPDR